MAKEIDDGFEKVLLPLGVQEFHEWSDKIIALTSLPNNDSMKFGLATMIMSLEAGVDRVSLESMAARLRKAASNQIAAFIVHELKEKQQAEIKKATEEAKAKAEKELEDAAKEVTSVAIADGPKQ